jgi:hypothetical protein
MQEAEKANADLVDAFTRGDATRAKRLVVFGEIVETPLDKGAEIDAPAKLPSCPTIQDERGR